MSSYSGNETLFVRWWNWKAAELKDMWCWTVQSRVFLGVPYKGEIRLDGGRGVKPIYSSRSQQDNKKEVYTLNLTVYEIIVKELWARFYKRRLLGHDDCTFQCTDVHFDAKGHRK
jgi:hypothetical protein